MTFLQHKDQPELDDSKVLDLGDARTFSKTIEVLELDDRFAKSVVVSIPIPVPVLDESDKVIGGAILEKVGSSIFAIITIDYSIPERLNLEVGDFKSWVRWDQCYFTESGQIDKIYLTSIKISKFK